MVCEKIWFKVLKVHFVGLVSMLAVASVFFTGVHVEGGFSMNIKVAWFFLFFISSKLPVLVVILLVSIRITM